MLKDYKGDFINLLLRLWRHLPARSQKQFFFVLVLTVLVSFLEVLTISAVVPFLMALTAPNKVMSHPIAHFVVESLSLSNSNQLMLGLTVLFAVIVIFAGIIRVVLLWASSQLSCRTGADIGINIYRRTLYQPYQVHISRNTSEVVSGVMVKANAVVSGVFSPLITLVGAIIMMLAILSTLLAINYKVALSALFGFGVIYGSILSLTRNRLRNNSDLISLELNQSLKALQEGLNGIRDVLIDGSQNTYCEIFRSADLRMRVAQANTLIIGQSPRYLIEALGTVLIVIIAYNLTVNGGGLGESLPLLGALALGAQRMLPVMQQAYASWTSIQGSRSHLRDIVLLLEQPLPDYAYGPIPRPLPFEHQIKLRHLSFSYSGNYPLIFENLNLSIPRGARVGFIGETGSGKSTLIDIIMGLLTPTEGYLEIDDAVITSSNQRSWQAIIAHVPQMIFLADSSIAENIAFGTPLDQIDFAKVKQAAEQAQIAELIESWPKSYQTTVGEKGIRLSGGQRQRIGIARALYKQAKVIIFDEATSALDSGTEEAVMTAIKNLDNDLTILLIAHRISTLSICNEVIEIGDKGILRRGSYLDLLNWCV